MGDEHSQQGKGLYLPSVKDSLRYLAHRVVCREIECYLLAVKNHNLLPFRSPTLSAPSVTNVIIFLQVQLEECAVAV